MDLAYGGESRSLTTSSASTRPSNAGVSSAFVGTSGRARSSTMSSAAETSSISTPRNDAEAKARRGTYELLWTVVRYGRRSLPQSSDWSSLGLLSSGRSLLLVGRSCRASRLVGYAFFVGD